MTLSNKNNVKSFYFETYVSITAVLLLCHKVLISHFMKNGEWGSVVHRIRFSKTENVQQHPVGIRFAVVHRMLSNFSHLYLFSWITKVFLQVHIFLYLYHISTWHVVIVWTSFSFPLLFSSQVHLTHR